MLRETRLLQTSDFKNDFDISLKNRLILKPFNPISMMVLKDFMS